QPGEMRLDRDFGQAERSRDVLVAEPLKKKPENRLFRRREQVSGGSNLARVIGESIDQQDQSFSSGPDAPLLYNAEGLENLGRVSLEDLKNPEIAPVVGLEEEDSHSPFLIFSVRTEEWICCGL